MKSAENCALVASHPTYDNDSTEDSEAQLLRLSQVPGPSSLPLIGQLHHFIPGGCYYGLSRTEIIRRLMAKYGPIVHLTMINGPSRVMITRPSDIRAMFEAEGAFPDRDDLHIYGVLRKSCGQSIGITNAKGTEWKAESTKFNKLLSKFCPNKMAFHCSWNISGELADHIRQNRNESNVIADATDMIKKWSLDTISTICFGKSFGNFNNDGVASELFQASDDFNKLSEKLLFSNAWRFLPSQVYQQARQTYSKMMQICLNHASRSFNNVNCESLIHRAFPDNLSEQDRSEIMDITGTFMIASIDTVVSAALFTLHCIGRYEHCQARVQEELLEVLGRCRKTSENHNGFEDDISDVNSNRSDEYGDHSSSEINSMDKISFQHIKQLSFLSCCIKESLRLYPPAPAVPRVLAKDAVMSGYSIPAGTKCVALTSLACRDPQYFPQPDTFLPERWMPDHELKPSEEVLFAYSPFGRGPRSCPGKRLAELMITVLLAHLLLNFKIQTVNDQIETEICVLRKPKAPVPLKFVDLSINNN